MTQIRTPKTSPKTVNKTQSTSLNLGKKPVKVPYTILAQKPNRFPGKINYRKNDWYKWKNTFWLKPNESLKAARDNLTAQPQQQAPILHPVLNNFQPGIIIHIVCTRPGREIKPVTLRLSINQPPEKYPNLARQGSYVPMAQAVYTLFQAVGMLFNFWVQTPRFGSPI